MGMPYEFNWYLVVKDGNAIQCLGNNLFQTVKQEARIYPLESEIPLITKIDGCVGMAKIKEFAVKETETTIIFEITHKYDPKEEIAQHYFGNYKRLHE